MRDYEGARTVCFEARVAIARSIEESPAASIEEKHAVLVNHQLIDSMKLLLRSARFEAAEFSLKKLNRKGYSFYICCQRVLSFIQSPAEGVQHALQAIARDALGKFDPDFQKKAEDLMQLTELRKMDERELYSTGDFTSLHLFAESFPPTKFLDTKSIIEKVDSLRNALREQHRESNLETQSSINDQFKEGISFLSAVLALYRHIALARSGTVGDWDFEADYLALDSLEQVFIIPVAAPPPAPLSVATTEPMPGSASSASLMTPTSALDTPRGSSASPQTRMHTNISPDLGPASGGSAATRAAARNGAPSPTFRPPFRASAASPAGGAGAGSFRPIQEEKDPIYYNPRNRSADELERLIREEGFVENRQKGGHRQFVKTVGTRNYLIVLPVNSEDSVAAGTAKTILYTIRAANGMDPDAGSP